MSPVLIEEIKSRENALSKDPNSPVSNTAGPWTVYVKPPQSILSVTMDPLAYTVTQGNGTEQAFRDGNYDDNKEQGIYVDILSGEPLFSSLDKFDSGTGWPSFSRPIDDQFVVTKKDFRLIYHRTEVRSRYGDNHIGHVFDDGPQPTGQRWCMNGAALHFVPLNEMEQAGYGDYARLFE